MKHFKKALALMLTASMVFTSFSVTTFASASDSEVEEVASGSDSENLTENSEQEQEITELVVEDTPQVVDATEEDALELTATPDDSTTSNQPYISNTTGGSQYFRIPAMVTLDDGTIVTAADARWNSTGDGGGNDTVVSYSTNKGATWNYTFANYLGDNGNTHNGASTCFIDPALATDGSTVYMLVDLFPAGYALNSANKTPVAGANGFDDSGNLRLSGDNRSSYGYYLSGNTIYSNSGTAVEGLTVDAKFNITGTYNGTSYDTNLFCADSPFQVYPTNYLYLTKSTDKGASWSDPTLINVKKAAEQTCLVGPGTGYVTSTGRIIYTVYNYTSGDKNTSVIYSDDRGATWKRSADVNVTSSEATLTEVKVGSTNTLYMFTRHGGYYTSTDNGATWSSQKSVSGISYNTGCQINVMTYSKTIDGKQAILLSAPGSTSSRSNGMIFVGLIQDDGSINWDYTYSVTSGTYQYSSITELNDGSIGLLYEPADGSITYTNLAISDIAKGATIEGETTVTYTASVSTTTAKVGGTITLSATASDGSDASATSWTSSDDSVLSVNGTTATANAAGTATLTAKLPDSSTQEFTITVSESASSDTDRTVKEETSEGGTVYKLDSDGIDVGQTYVIYSATGSRILYASSSGSTTDQVTAPSVSTETDGLITLNTGFDDSTQLWTVTSNGIQSQASSKYLYLKDTSTSGIPLKSSSGNYTEVTFTASGNGYLVKLNSNSSTRYLYNTGSKFGVTNSSSSATVFYFYKKTTTVGGTTYTADNSKLLELISTASALTQGDYSAESWTALQNALTAATAIGTPTAYDTVEKAQTEQVAINTAAANLNTAINALVKVENISVVVGKTATVENLTGTLDTSSLDKTIATATLSNGTLTVTGVKEGTTSLKVGDLVYNVTVKPDTVDVDTDTTPFIVGTNSITTGAGEKLTKLSTSVGTSYDIDLGTAYASSSATWSMADTTIATVDSNGKVTGVAAGETTLYCVIGGVTYAMPIVVYDTGSSSASSTKTCSLHTTEITDTQVWYAWNLLTGNDNMPTTMIKAVDGEAIYVEFPSGDAYCINYYGAPDDGYALTFMSATNSAGQYLAVDDKDDVTQCDWYANSGACYNERTNQTYISSSNTRLTTIQNEIKTAISTAKAYTEEGVSASGLSTDGAQGFSRGTSDTGKTDCDLTFRSEKLPTVTKTITSIKRGSTTIPYTEGMTAQAGDVIIFKVSVKQYKTTEAIVYTSDTLTDNLSGATFVNGGGTTKSGMLSDSTLDADTTYDYDVQYTIQDADLDKDIENTVDLTYNYSSTYSSGTFAGSAEAAAKISAATFTPKDIVIDFGNPVTVDYSGTDDHGRYDLESGTATYGDVTVSGNKVTYTPKTVLLDADTVTITNTAGGTTTFKVYPATTVYYDESFATDCSGFSEGTKDTTAQNTWEIGSCSDEYGYDSSIAGEALKSGVITADASKATADFSFTGTGLDVYAKCTADSGNAFVKLYKDGSLVKMAYVKTDSDSTIYSTKGTDEYGLPIFSATGMEYGNYRVQVYTASSNVNIDGFRVYETLDTNEPAGYTNDGEDNPSFYELRNALLFADDSNIDTDGYSADSTTPYPQVLGNNAAGVTAVTLSEDGTTVGKDILENGPKNEIFLEPGATLTFKVNTDRNIQIGLKAVNEAGSCTLNGTAISLDNAIDMFHEVAKSVDSDGNQTITIVNTGYTVISVTKMKVCDDPNATFVPLTDEDLTDAYAALGLIAAPEVTYADATCTVALKDCDGNVVASTDLTANGEEGNETSFAAADIKAAAEEILPEGYAFVDESAIADTMVAFGESGTAEIQIGKIATLNITYKKGFKTIGTATLTHVQDSSSKKYTFSTAEIKAAAPSGARVISLWGTSVKYGSTSKLTALCY